MIAFYLYFKGMSLEISNETTHPCVIVCINQDHVVEGTSDQNLAIEILKLKPSMLPIPGTLHNLRSMEKITIPSSGYRIVVYKHSDGQCVLIDELITNHVIR